MGPGLPGRHAQPSSPASQLPAGDSAGPGRVLGPHPHRVHHRGLGARHQGRQGQLQQPGAQVLASMNWNIHSIDIRTMNPGTHSPDTFAGGIFPFHTQNENHVNIK